MTSKGSARPNASQRLSAQRVEAAKARIAAEQRRRRIRQVGIPIAAILAVVIALVAVKFATNAGAPKSGVKASAAANTVVTDVANVPPNTFNTIGKGTVKAIPTPVSAPPLTSAGLPLVLYAGAEYCPYCATERWAFAVAMSRFGTFSNLGQTASSPNDVYPSTATLTFHGASYTSKYLALTAKELQSNQVVNGQYAALDTLSPADQAVMAKYDAPPYFQNSGAIPFIDIGGRYLISGASYDPAVLQGKTHAQIAAALSDPTSAIAQAVDGTANVLTAAICKITNSAPSQVCSSPGVIAAAAALHNAS